MLNEPNSLAAPMLSDGPASPLLNKSETTPQVPLWKAAALERFYSLAGESDEREDEGIAPAPVHEATVQAANPRHPQDTRSEASSVAENSGASVVLSVVPSA